MPVQIAYLLQSEPDAGLTDAALRAALLADWPDLDEALLTPVEGGADGDEPLSFSYDGTMVALLSVPASMGDDLAQVAAHSRLWPADQPVPVDYRAHTIVTVFSAADDAGHPDALARSVLLSRVVATAIGMNAGVQAVYVGAAEHVVHPEVFRALARDLLPEPLVPAWIAFNVGPRPEGPMTGHTRGLGALGLMDVEIPATDDAAAEVLDRLVGIAEYQLANGPVIGDGDTLGATAEAQLVARHAPSAFDAEATVLRLEVVAEPAPPRRGFLRRRR